MNMNVNKDDVGIKPLRPLQMLTLAHAVRPRLGLNKNSVEASNKKLIYKPSTNKISLQIKETLKMKNDTTAWHQAKSYPPMGIIVSKMATRKRVPVEHQNLQENLDSLMCSGLLKQQHPTILTQGKQYLGSGNIISEASTCSCSTMNSPSLDYNYRKLYEGNQRSPEYQCEDPLVFDKTVECPQTKQRSTKVDNESIFKSPVSSVHQQELDPEPEFVWNPVIGRDRPTRQLSPLYETDDDDPLALHSKHIIETDSKYNRNKLPFVWDSPCSSGNCESSSTSSGHTIAEEKLQYTVYAKRGVMSMHNPWSSPKHQTPRWGFYSDDNNCSCQHCAN